MATVVSNTGPGVLTIGEPGSEIDVAAQATNVTVTSDSSADEPTEVLSGDTVGGSTSYADKLNVSMLSDYMNASGLVALSWTARGTEVPFTFEPVTGEIRITGTVRLDPIELGGEVGSRSDVSFSFDGIGPFIVDTNPA